MYKNNAWPGDKVTYHFYLAVCWNIFRVLKTSLYSVILNVPRRKMAVTFLKIRQSAGNLLLHTLK